MTYRNDLETLVRTESVRLERRAARIVGAVHAPDVVQDVFVKIWERARDSFVLTPSYLAIAVRNTAIDRLRREKLNRSLSEGLTEHQYGPSVPTPEQIAIDADQIARIDAALRALPERRRHIFLMNRRLGCGHAEIADALGISVSTVTREIARALAACQAAVEADDP